jgi:CHAT domain-containing protein/Tfp pilus assembly protein PilF
MSEENCQPLKIWRADILLVTLWMLCAFFAYGAKGSPVSQNAEGDAQAQRLAQARTVERELKRGEAHTYLINLQPGQFLRVLVVQQSLNVWVVLRDPAGVKLVQVDLADEYGTEPVSYEAQAGGDYLLEVTSSSAMKLAGRYSVESFVKSHASADDITRATAEQLLIEAKELFRSGRPSNLRRALSKAGQSLPLWLRLDDKYWVAYTFNSLGGISTDLGERQHALGYYWRALNLLRNAGDMPGVAVTLANIGFYYRHAGQQQQAVDFLKQAVEAYRAAGFRLAASSRLNDIGLIYSDHGEDRKALDFYNEALALVRDEGEHLGEAGVLNNIGNVYRRLGDREKALSYYGQALLLYRADGKQGEESNTLINVGDLYSEARERDKASEYYNRAVAHGREIGEPVWEAKALWKLGELHRQFDERPQALDSYRQGLELLRKTRQVVGQTELLLRLGALYNDLGEWQKAAEYYLEALRLYREQGNGRGEANTLSKIGDVYIKWDKRKAIDYYLQAARAQRAVGDIPAQAATFKDLIIHYSDLRQWRTALYYYGQALKLYKAIGDRNGEAQAFVNFGVSLKGQNRLSEARGYFERAIPLFQETKSAGGEATALDNLGLIYQTQGDKPKALEYFARAKQLYHDHDCKDGEADTLWYIGSVYLDLGDQRKALEQYQQALTLYRESGDASNGAYLLMEMARTYDKLGEARQELDSYEEAVTLHRAAGDRRGQAETLNAIAEIYVSQDNPREALKRYEQALELYREAGDRWGEAYTLNSIGDAHSSLDEYREAMGYYRAALPLWRSLDERGREADTFTYTCGMYLLLRDKQMAQACLHQAVAIHKATRDYEGERQALAALGLTYIFLRDRANAHKSLLQALTVRKRARENEETTMKAVLGSAMVFFMMGDAEGALSFYEKVLSFSRTNGNRKLTALALTSAGKLYSLMEDEPHSLSYFNQALPLYRALGDREGEAVVLDDIGIVYLTRNAYRNFNQSSAASTASALMQGQQGVLRANEYLQSSLSLYRSLGNRHGEAQELLNLCYARLPLGDKQGALEYCTRSLSLVDEASAPGTYSGVTAELMRIWDDLSSPELAIAYGKESVNAIQTLRTQINKLDADAGKYFTQIIADPYRELADILIRQGRLLEAEQVLGMLKEQEYFQFIRRDDKVARELLTRVDLSPTERAALERYDQIADEIVRLGDEYVRLEEQRRKLRPEQTKDIVARQEEIDKDLAAARKTLSLFLEELRKKFGERDVRVAEVDEGLQALVRNWNEPHTAVVFTILGKDRLNIILMTEGVPRAYVKDKIGDEDFTEERLNTLIYELQAAAKDPRIDPRPAGQKLYDILIKPLEKDLQAMGADTIVWSLDGNLRYVPVAALYDARNGYLAERYASVIITLASIANLELHPAEQSQWRALGLGVSKPVAGFAALENVPEELRAIVRDTERHESTGLLDGHRLLDEQFTLSAFRLHLGHYNVIHAATHFHFITGTRNESLQSFLLLGDGEKLTLADVKDAGPFFSGVELLVLSACETAAGGKGADGREIEGFGALAQKAGARAVLATLWRVADASTRELMVKFYQLHGTAPNVSKAEALRQAQLALLHGEWQTNGIQPRAELAAGEHGKAPGPAFQTNPLKPYAHPYYWAPFILIGNWR